MIAIDFDGCLCSDAYPEIGAPNWDVIVEAKNEQTAGAKLILWTCREGKLLEDAVNACIRWGLKFDAINESLPAWRAMYDNDPRKIGATEYWDDKARRMPLLPRPDGVAGNSISTEQVKSMWDGCYFCQLPCDTCKSMYEEMEPYGPPLRCHSCKDQGYSGYEAQMNFCENCGRPLSVAAIEMMREKLEAINDRKRDG